MTPTRRLAAASAVAVCLTAGATWASAQDVHLTQFYASPLLLNPALTGGFPGQLRASAQYRDQWRGVVENPFTTTSATLDFRFPLSNSGPLAGDAAAAGVTFLNDRIRAYDYSFNKIAASGAYHKLLDKSTGQILSAGLQVAVGQRNVNYANLTFQDELEIEPAVGNTPGSIGFTGMTREVLPQNNIAYFDLGVGINYSYVPRNLPAVYAGLAVHHVNAPDISFYSRDEGLDLLPEGELRDEARLDRRFVAHVASVIPLEQGLSLQPRALVQAQGESLETVLGSNLRFQFDAFSSTALHVGVWGRGVRHVDGFGADAVVGLLGLELYNVLIGTSYDVGVSDFSAGSRGRGALEISLAYLGNYSNDTVLCPSF